MKATKYTLEVMTQGLSKDIFSAMLTQVSDALAAEIVQGEHKYDDGDSVFWRVTAEEVEF